MTSNPGRATRPADKEQGDSLSMRGDANVLNGRRKGEVAVTLSALDVLQPADSATAAKLIQASSNLGLVRRTS
jgi:hypothetical protein